MRPRVDLINKHEWVLRACVWDYGKLESAIKGFKDFFKEHKDAVSAHKAEYIKELKGFLSYAEGQVKSVERVINFYGDSQKLRAEKRRWQKYATAINQVLKNLTKETAMAKKAKTSKVSIKKSNKKRVSVRAHTRRYPHTK